MTKQVNPNIGHVACPICSDLAAVRKNRAGRFYFDCLNCGRITPNHSGGQKFVMDKATIWGAAGAPADLPAWIREQWSYGKSLRQGKPSPEPDTAAPPPPAPAQVATLPPPPKRKDAIELEITEGASVQMKRGFTFLEL